MQKTRKKRNEQDEEMEVEESPGENGGTQISDQDCLINGDLDHISDDEEGGVRIGEIYIPPAPKPALTFDATGPRMIITHIVNENFKSYAGIQTLGPFHKSFTAIIGPNGSGKSNVIDSMLFVFGYRASKIRSKKISVLIHSSSKFPNVQSASVAVHFCQIVDGVSSVIYFVFLPFFLAMYIPYVLPVDIIFQGEVEQIAMMKPKAQTEHESGMLEYLEDIIGTSRYKEPIEQLSVKVEELSEMRKEKLNRVRLAEQEKQQLEGPMKDTIELINLINIWAQARNKLLQKYVREANLIVEKRRQEMIEVAEKLEEIDANLARIRNKLQDKKGLLKAGNKKYDELRKQKDDLTEKLQAMKRKTVTIQADITQSNKKRKNLEQLLEQEKGKLIDLELIPEKNKREIAECEKLLQKHIENKENSEKELEAVMAGVRSKTQGLQEQKDRIQARLMDFKRTVEEAKKDYNLAESQLKIYLSVETKETEKLRKMKEAYEKAAQDLISKKTLQEELESSVPTNERQLNELQSRLQAIKREESSVSSDSRSLRAQLEESRQAMSANKSRGRVLDALMKEKRNGNIPGIFGRLGDLGGIDTKYDVAISTCCGALDNIVVDTVETAQACVEHLKRHDIGRATFIALNKQEHLKQQYEMRITYPENVPRLFDLVKIKDERVLPAFYFALRDTLVANDLDQASRIAYGATRYRVVTLKGDVIEIAGSMTGGGKTTMRGRMSSSVQQDTSEQDPAAVQANERKLAALEQRLTELRSEQAGLEDQIVTLQRQTREGKTTLHKLNVELRSLTEQVPVLENQITQQEQRAAASKVDPQQKANMEATLKEAEEKLDKAKHDAGEVEKEVRGVDAQIAAVAGGKVKDLQKIVDELTKKINKVSTEITKLKVAINTSVRNAKKSKDTINQMDTDLRNTQQNLESLNEQKKQLTLDTAQHQKLIEELEEGINEGADEFTDLRAEIARLQDKEDQIKSERVDAQNVYNSKEKNLNDAQASKPSWENELLALHLEEPGYDNLPGYVIHEPLRTLTNDELEEFTLDEIRNIAAAHRARFGEQKPNYRTIQEYKAKEELYLRRAAELDEITTRRNDMRTLYDQLKKKRTTDFLCGFNTITTKLKEMYQMITLGGDAELELVDSLDPFTEGIIFSVRPPNKSWKNISNLSGGEKTLSSLALVFALHYYKPTPLYVMDEIDAALDFKNVSIVANYIKERTKNAQFIIISLRYNMFEVSNRLVGIYKTEDCTKSVTIENKLPEPVTPAQDIEV
ncbi:structural maintenance of chromosomes protein 4 [Hyposmocoma kahamanoa]|uniref:structural maintenance of chromosomes protein 4 n=1 Tax=Hyposmocoma kahamanoa TaxID=1477025 RepID=UPI000E6D861B|nr:structural maintenance of chromosomes protein 4 [Hyposmocoma kahamanoa]